MKKKPLIFNLFLGFRSKQLVPRLSSETLSRIQVLNSLIGFLDYLKN